MIVILASYVLYNNTAHCPGSTIFYKFPVSLCLSLSLFARAVSASLSRLLSASLPSESHKRRLGARTLCKRRRREKMAIEVMK